MGQTPNLALPYPEQNDPDDVPVDIKELADRIEALHATGIIGAPAGVMLPFAGPTNAVPSGWLPCDGRALSRTTYATLYTALGTLWGGGDGSSTFNIPDLRQRIPVGQYGSDPVGFKGGAWDHKHEAGTLVASDHYHNINHVHYVDHVHAVVTSNVLNTVNTGQNVPHPASGQTGGSTKPYTDGPNTGVWSGATDRGNPDVSGDTAGNNQAYAIVLYIIKT